MSVPCRLLLLATLAFLPATALAQAKAVYAWRNLAGQPAASGTNDGTNRSITILSPPGKRFFRLESN